MKRSMYVILAAVVLSVIFSTGCKKSQNTSTKGSEMQEVLTPEQIAQWQEKLKTIEAVPVEAGEIGVIETNLGTIKFKFFTDAAPNHCANFKKLANSGFYDGTTFHRVIPGFMIQGGDINSRNDNPLDDGTGSPGYTVNAEFSGILKHKRGIVSMARKGNDINSAGSQFFIMVADYPSLDGQYSIFGEVIEGMDVADKIVSVQRNERDRPLENVYMKKVQVIKQ